MRWPSRTLTPGKSKELPDSTWLPSAALCHKYHKRASLHQKRQAFKKFSEAARPRKAKKGLFHFLLLVCLLLLLLILIIVIIFYFETVSHMKESCTCNTGNFCSDPLRVSCYSNTPCPPNSCGSISYKKCVLVCRKYTLKDLVDLG